VIVAFFAVTAIKNAPSKIHKYFLTHIPMDQSQENQLEQPCACGSGKKAGACCKSGQSCSCGSGKPAGECCYKQQ